MGTLFTQEDIMKTLNTLYKKTVDGLGAVSPPVSDLAKDYLKMNSNVDTATQIMQAAQIAKCTTSGFVTGFGGLLALPVTVPANITSVLYVQMRMIACTARLGGYDLKSDQTQTFIYACLAGVAVNQFVKQFGVKLGTKVATKAVEKIPGKVLTKINQMVSFRLITKFGEKGLINLGKMIPVVGAFVGGGLDYAETKVIAGRAYKWFIEGDYTAENNEEDQIIDISEEEITEVQPSEEVTSEKQEKEE